MSLWKTHKQYLLNYSGVDIESVKNKILTDWETVYQDCKIATISIVDGGYGLFHALVVFEELEESK